MCIGHGPRLKWFTWETPSCWPRTLRVAVQGSNVQVGRALHLCFFPAHRAMGSCALIALMSAWESPIRSTTSWQVAVAATAFACRSWGCRTRSRAVRRSSARRRFFFKRLPLKEDAPRRPAASAFAKLLLLSCCCPRLACGPSWGLGGASHQASACCRSCCGCCGCCWEGVAQRQRRTTPRGQ